MKKNRELLERALLHITEKYNVDNKVKQKVVETLEEHGMPTGKIIGILNQSEGLPITNPEVVPDAELYLFAKALYDQTGEPSIKPSDFFNEEEIKTYDLYKLQLKKDSNYLRFDSVQQIADNQYLCFISIQKLNEYFRNGLITYNFRTQRGAKFVAFNEQLLATPDIKETPVLEMTEKILTNKFTQNMISFNIRRTGGEKYNYNLKTKSLEIEIDNKESFCDIIDGMHRSLSAMRAYQKNPNINFGFVLNVLHYTEAEAQEFIVQEDKRTPINKSIIASYTNDDVFITISKDINKYGTDLSNAMHNKFATSVQEIKRGEKYVTFEVFSESLDYNFDITEPREVSQITSYLIDYFNELIGILKDRGLKGTIAFHNLMFAGYIALAAKLKNKENWKTELNNVINNLDFNNNVWSELGIVKNTNPRINKTIIKKISQYIIKQI